MPFATSESRWWPSTWAERMAVVLIIGVFAALGFAYSVRVPPFETPDEVHHYAFARHLALGNPLPIQTTDSRGRWEHEGTQAPLYYYLLGRLIAGIDQSDFDAIDQVNPYANLGNPLYPGNKNYMLYSAVERPSAGTVLAVYVGRWFSLFLGIFTLLFCYGIARLAFPGSVALPLLALATTAAIPQFQFISATVSNDNAVILFGSAVIFWLARLLTFAPERPLRWWDLGILGVLLGAAALSKLQGLGLLGLAGLVICWLAWLRKDVRLLLRAFLPVAVPVVLIAGWWYWRNFSLYGDWLGVDQLLSINGMRSEPRTAAQFWGELRGVRYSFWGLFGWFSILLPVFIYRVLDVISVVAVFLKEMTQVSLWRAAADRPAQQARRVHLLLLVWFAMLLFL
ncbi:MAG: phospholipid carrier-dependent glycosyltransferase, partial [Caldilineaceae bacterium]|nr:phospholipid carrier-dependent glycosyltransferase [Caldilineaceae bacterium]